MKPLKFRVWHQQTQKMYAVKSIDFKADGINVQIYGLIDPAPGTPHATKHNRLYNVTTLMQFTGFLDASDRDVYVGDIAAGWLGQDRWVGTIEYEEETGMYRLVERYGGRSQALFMFHDLQVISNIYASPEVLTAEASA